MQQQQQQPPIHRARIKKFLKPHYTIDHNKQVSNTGHQSKLVGMRFNINEVKTGAWDGHVVATG